MSGTFKSDRHAALGMAFPSETPNRLHARHCKVRPLPKGNAFQRAARAVASAWAAWMKPASPETVNSWADRGL